jgi:hypothetical protein
MVGLEGAVPMAIYTCVQLFQGSLPIWCKITVYVSVYGGHALSPRPLTTEARIRSQTSPYGICGERIGTERVSLRLP